MSYILKAEELSLSFREDHHLTHVLDNIHFSVEEGEFLMLLGPSGSGKSSILRLLAGLIPPTKGKIFRKENLKLSFIFQGFALFPWLTVEENVAFGLHMEGIAKHERITRARAQIETMGLTGFEHAYPRELSGGMKQRVGIARALATNPDVILLDEPFSALDSFTAKKLREDLLRIWQERKVTIVMVTHLIEEAVLLADRIAVLSMSPARIEATVKNVLPRPRIPRSKEFFDLSDQLIETIKF